jgi:hypothetical protein
VKRGDDVARRTECIVDTSKTENCCCSECSQTVPIRLSYRLGWMQGRDVRSEDIRLLGH